MIELQQQYFSMLYSSTALVYSSSICLLIMYLLNDGLYENLKASTYTCTVNYPSIHFDRGNTNETLLIVVGIIG